MFWQSSTLGIESAVHRIISHQSPLSIWRNIHLPSQCSIVSYFTERCSSHSKNNLVRMFNVWHNILLSELSLHFTRLLLIYHCFQLGKYSFWIILLYYAVFLETYNSHSKINWIRMLYVLHKFPLMEFSLIFIWLLPIYNHFQFGETFILADPGLLLCIS
jgi:hypothetical protein